MINKIFITISVIFALAFASIVFLQTNRDSIVVTSLSEKFKTQQIHDYPANNYCLLIDSGWEDNPQKFDCGPLTKFPNNVHSHLIPENAGIPVGSRHLTRLVFPDSTYILFAAGSDCYDDSKIEYIVSKINENEVAFEKIKAETIAYARTDTSTINKNTFFNNQKSYKWDTILIELNLSLHNKEAKILTLIDNHIPKIINPHGCD